MQSEKSGVLWAIGVISSYGELCQSIGKALNMCQVLKSS